MSIIKFDVEKIKSQEDFNGAINELLYIIDDRSEKVKLISRFMIDLIDYFDSLPEYNSYMSEPLVFDCLYDYVEQYTIKSKYTTRIENAIIIIRVLASLNPIVLVYKNIAYSRPQAVNILKLIVNDKSLFYNTEVKEELLYFINSICNNNYIFDGNYDFIIEALENIEKDISSNLYHDISEVSKKYFKHKNNNINMVDCLIPLENVYKTYIDVINRDNINYYLNKMLTLNIHRTLDGYYLTEDEIGIEAFGEDMSTAIWDFNDSFSALVNNYLLEDDTKLSDDALKLKNTLKLIIKDVRKEFI